MTDAFRVNRRQYLVEGPAKSRRPHRIPAPVVTLTFPPIAYAFALQYADGQKERCFPVDGAVIIANSERRPKWLS